MMNLKYYKISSGVGRAKDKLVAFDSALLHAKIGNYNLLRVSSILPPFTKHQLDISLPEGSLLPTAYGTITTNAPGDIIAAAVAVGIPKDPSKPGVIMEFEGHCKKDEAEKIVYSMTAEAMCNHAIDVLEIRVSSIDAVSDGTEYVSCIAAVAMWE